MNRTFQRTNWSNEQILHFLDGQKIVNGAGEVDEYCQEFNDVVDDIKEFFRGFTVPEEEFGAMGYCAEEDQIYHIGELPEPLKVPIKECAIPHSPENESNFEEELNGEHYCEAFGEDWKPRKPIAGYRFFRCSDCENYWREESRDCKSPSGESCPKCGEFSYPFNIDILPALKETGTPNCASN